MSAYVGVGGKDKVKEIHGIRQSVKSWVWFLYDQICNFFFFTSRCSSQTIVWMTVLAAEVGCVMSKGADISMLLQNTTQRKPFSGLRAAKIARVKKEQQQQKKNTSHFSSNHNSTFVYVAPRWPQYLKVKQAEGRKWHNQRRIKRLASQRSMIFFRKEWRPTTIKRGKVTSGERDRGGNHKLQ